MCNLGMGIYEKGIEMGGILASVKSVNKLIKTGYSLENALELAQIDEETYNKYKCLHEYGST